MRPFSRIWPLANKITAHARRSMGLVIGRKYTAAICHDCCIISRTIAHGVHYVRQGENTAEAQLLQTPHYSEESGTRIIRHSRPRHESIQLISGLNTSDLFSSENPQGHQSCIWCFVRGASFHVSQKTYMFRRGFVPRTLQNINRVKWRHRVYGHDTIAILWV